MKLTIKAANGLVQDFQMEAPSAWTVLEIKLYLFKHYPTKPAVISQKLICGGKLLQDVMIISQLNSTVGGLTSPTEESLVIHLVVYERSVCAPSPSASTTSISPSTSLANISQNDNTNSSPGSSQDQDRADGERVEFTGATPFRPIEPQIGLRHRGGMVPNQNNIQNVQNLPMFAPYAFPMGPPPQFYAPPYGAAYANHFQQWYNMYHQPREPGPGEGVGHGQGVGGGGDGHPLDLPVNPAARNELPEPDDPEDLPMNAPGGVGMMGGGGGGGLRHRDMVDYLYMLMMIGFLVLVAYLTGSLGRLLVFAAGVIFMLLNQAGLLTLQRRRVAAHEHVPAPQPPPEEGRGRDAQDEADGAERAPEGTNQPPAEVAAPQDAHSSAPPPLPPLAPEVEQRGHGFLATIMVFVTAFFSSLVPQQRLHVN